MVMNLRTFIGRDRKKVDAIAQATGVHWTTVYRWARGENVPPLTQIAQITRCTNGEVTVHDFMEDAA